MGPRQLDRMSRIPTLSCLSRLRPNPLGLKPTPNRSLAVVPALRPAPVAFPRGALNRPLAYVAAAMILFGLANGLTLFEISFVGDRRSGMIISGAIQLTR